MICCHRWRHGEIDGGRVLAPRRTVLSRPAVLLLTPGNASDVTTAPDLMAEAPGRIRRLIADKGYDADWLRTDLRTKGITPVIPGTRARKRRVHHDKRRYRER